jgi:hypothetical protein
MLVAFGWFTSLSFSYLLIFNRPECFRRMFMRTLGLPCAQNWVAFGGLGRPRDSKGSPVRNKIDSGINFPSVGVPSLRRFWTTIITYKLWNCVFSELWPARILIRTLLTNGRLEILECPVNSAERHAPESEPEPECLSHSWCSRYYISDGPHAPHGPMESMDPVGTRRMGPGPGPGSLVRAADLRQNTSWKKVMCPILKSGVLSTFSEGIRDQRFHNQAS